MLYFLFIFILDRICYSSSLVFWCICIPVLLFSQPLKSLIHSCERLSCVSQTAARIPIIFIENSDRYTVKYTAKELMPGPIVNSDDGKLLEHSDIKPLRKKPRNTELALFVYCSGVLFFSLTFSIVSCTMSLFPREYFVPRRIFPICCQKFPLTANLTIVEKAHQIIPIKNIFVPRLSI